MKAWQLRKRVREGGLAHRALTIAMDTRPWYDWGHRGMVLLGQCRHGDYEEPRGRDLWYHSAWEGGRNRFVTTYRYADVRDAPREEWKVFDVQEGGQLLMLGWWGNRINFTGLDRRELALFRRWDLWECRFRSEWFGVRRWAYHRALHSAVHVKKPFACNAVPPRGSGGYSHWYCELRGKHTQHRYRSYTWSVDEGLVYVGSR